MVKNTSGKMNNNDLITRQILSVIREGKNCETTLIKEEVEPQDNSFVINKNTPIFGEVGEKMKENVIQTVGELILFDDNALTYSSAENGLTLTGKIRELNLDFQFKSSGCTIRVDGLNLTDDTYRTIGKVLSSFNSWRETQASDGDLLTKLQQYAERQS